jgi:delta 1-pyrroline-5-carboxylate dehydrogenase
VHRHATLRLKPVNDMRIFQGEIFGPVLAVTTFSDEQDALNIANQTLYGLGAGVWTRDLGTAYRMGRGIQAGRVWTNCYHLYPAHAAFGGYKQSGIGRENHKMMLDHYQQTRHMPANPPHRQEHDEAGRDHAGGRGLRRQVTRSARAVDVPPVRRLLRRFVPDVLSRRRFHHRSRRRPARRGGRLRVLDGDRCPGSSRRG